VGFFGRSLEALSRITKETLDVPSETTPFPGKILYPLDFFPLPNATQQGLIDQFVSVLERQLDITKTEISLASEWTKNPPDGTEGQSLQEYMKNA
jgi:hypothetical protein